MVSKVSKGVSLARARNAGHTLVSDFLIAQGKSGQLAFPSRTGVFFRPIWKTQGSEPAGAEVECQMSAGSTAMHKRSKALSCSQAAASPKPKAANELHASGEETRAAHRRACVT